MPTSCQRRPTARQCTVCYCKDKLTRVYGQSCGREGKQPEEIQWKRICENFMSANCVIVSIPRIFFGMFSLPESEDSQKTMKNSVARSLKKVPAALLSTSTELSNLSLTVFQALSTSLVSCSVPT